jgi:hypothetical protein
VSLLRSFELRRARISLLSPLMSSRCASNVEIPIRRLTCVLLYRNPSPPNHPRKSRQVSFPCCESEPASFFPYPTLITSSAFSHHQNDALAITPVVAETATTPALDAAESAPFDSVPVVPAKHESTPAGDLSVVKSAVDTDAAPTPAVDGIVKAPIAGEQGEVKKDVEGKKEVVQEKAKKEKRDKKVWLFIEIVWTYS